MKLNEAINAACYLHTESLLLLFGFIGGWQTYSCITATYLTLYFTQQYAVWTVFYSDTHYEELIFSMNWLMQYNTAECYLCMSLSMMIFQ